MINFSMGVFFFRVGFFGDVGWLCIVEYGWVWLGLGLRGSSFGVVLV